MSTIPQTGLEVERKPWQTGLAPVYIGTFLWIAFFDQIGRRALPVGGLAWSMLGAALAGPLAYLLMFRPSGLWGHRVGKPLKIVSTSTFGIKGALLVPGLVLGIAQVLLFAVAVGYAIELTFQGLVLLGLVDPIAMRPTRVGGAVLKSPLYLATALVWAVITALVSLRFTRWIAHLMQYFPIFPAVAIGLAMMLMMVGLRSFLPTGIDPAMPAVRLSAGEGGVRAFLLTLQWVFAFSAMGGLLGADWGSASLEARDVTVGGWVGVGLAPAILSALALISVAGYQGSKEAERAERLNGGSEEPRMMTRSTIEEIDPGGRVVSARPTPGLDAPPFTFRAVANGGFGRYLGGAMLIVFGLASLAPAVYASFTFGLEFKALGPGVSRLTWTMLGTCAAWLLIVGGWFDRTEVAFNILGATFAPAAGAIAADYRRQKGKWPGPREGINPAGLIAWAVGLAVGLTPTVARAVGSTRLATLQPAALGAFVAAYLVYELLALVRLESAPSPHGWAESE
jgi:cytosine permease